MSRLRLGVIGLGNIGNAHLRSHLPNVPRIEVTAVADADADRRAAYPQYPGFASTAELLDSGLVDAVLVGTPHFDHPASAIAALRAGKHVLTEKPVAADVAAARAVNAVARETGLVYAAMFNQRTDPLYRALRTLVHGGELGEIRRVDWTVTDWFRPDCYYASGGWRATWAGEGGGVLLNQAPHNLDLYRWIFGMPRAVSAVVGFGRYHDVEVEDDVVALFRHAGGRTDVFRTTTGEAPGTNRLEVAAERGRVVVEGGQIVWNRTTVPVSEFCRTTSGAFSAPETWRVEVPRARGGGGQHTEVLANFADAVLDGAPLIAPAAEGVESVELANAALLAGWQDRTIELPLSDEEYTAWLRARSADSRYRPAAPTTEVAALSW